MAAPPAAAAAAAATTHPLTRYLRLLMRAKRSTLCVSADVPTAAAMLALADAAGPSIVVFKTHADTHAGWDGDARSGTGARLAALARRHRFLVFEDRKFADVGFTVQQQYAGGDHRIRDWAHVVNAHVLPGPDMLRALALSAAEWKEEKEEEEHRQRPAADPCAVPRPAGPAGRSQEEQAADIPEPPDDRALLLLAQMSSAGNLLDERYTAACVDMAREQRGFVMGFIALGPLNSEPADDFVVLTPGCALPLEQSLDRSEFAGSDALGQRYVTPEQLMMRGCDVIIVGTGICNAKDPAAKAEQYRKAAWAAYEARMGSAEWSLS